MKGVVLAGGNGTRLRPLTLVTNKHLLPVYDKPMVFYPIETLKKGGINEIMVVVGGTHAGHFFRVLKNGEDFGVSIKYAYQEGAGGIAQALGLVEEFADGDDICVILGDNTTDYNISSDVLEFSGGAHIFVKAVHDPERFGVASIGEGYTVTKIVEKPENPESNYAVTGLYMYDYKCFDFIKKLVPSARGELEITDLNNSYLKIGKLKASLLDGYWKDAGSPHSLYEASKFWAERNND